MKKLFIFFILIFGMIFGIFAERTLAVATFDVSGNAVTREESEAITELYITELVSTGSIKVIDRRNFDKILKEMKFQASDWSDAKKTIELGKVTNVELIARGQIIKLGTKMYLSATFIDVQTANILTSSRKQFESVDDIFDLLGSFAKELISNIQNAAIGQIGQGGGIIFHVEGKHYYECSENLGQTTWSSANSICAEYRGGGFDDWHLPSKEELNWIYQNLRKSGKIAGDDKYWTSSSAYYSGNGGGWDTVWVQNFANGEYDYQYGSGLFWHPDGNRKNESYCVRAVRSYIVED